MSTDQADPRTPPPRGAVPGHASPPAHPPLPAAPEGTPAPAGGTPDADDAPPAGTSGAEFRRQWTTARAARNYGRRKQAARWVPRAARSAGEQYRPGDGDAA